MSSYADVAASSGPTGAAKIPEPVKVERKTEPSGSVETVSEEEFEKIKKEASKIAEESVRAGKEKVKDFKKELADWESKGKPYFEKALSYVQEKYAAVSSYVQATVNSEQSTKARKELQNPVVIGQLAVILGAATAGYFVYAERARIRTENKYVLALHAGVVTALVLGDKYVFEKLYPKYKKL